jgi:protein-tyrosine phosphatase
VINLMEAEEKGHFGEPFVPYEKHLEIMAEKLRIKVSTTRIAVKDVSVPTSATMKMILDEIDRPVVVGQAVYAHCWGGRGRTGTVVGCYLVRHGLPGMEALERINHLRRNCADASSFSPETAEQREMVLSWKE